MRPEAPAPAMSPGTVGAFVRVESCAATRCEGTIVEIAGRGMASPVLGVDQRVSFEVDASMRALRQGEAPAFRPGAVLHLVLAEAPEAVGSPEGVLRVAEVLTPGLRS